MENQENGNGVKVCSMCGNKISINATVCPICGNGKQNPKNKWEQKIINDSLPRNAGKPRSRVIAVLLSWIGFGFCYMYLGYQNKFADRASRYIRSIFYMVIVIGIPYGMLLLFYALALHIYDMLYMAFGIKYDAYGNPITWSGK